MTRFSVLALALALVSSTAFAQNELTNPGFESGDFTGWNVFGNGFVEAAGGDIVPLSGGFDCKMFGNFSGGFDVTGIFQSFPAAPGQMFEMSSNAYHASSDPMLGVGPAADNWVVQKIAFFDGVGEIAGVESIILDGTFATDTWHASGLITATAPAGTVEVQALILYLQPANDGGAAQIDDVFFRNITQLQFPGTGDDIELATGVTALGATSATAPTTGGGADLKTANPLDFLTVRVSSPMGSFYGAPIVLVADSYATGGSAPAGLVPGSVYVGIGFQTLVNGVGAPLGLGSAIIPGGTDFSTQIPASLSGLTIILQAAGFSGLAANGSYGASEAHNIAVN